MTRRLNVTLDKPKGAVVPTIPHIIENIETEDLSVEKWSCSVIDKMFEAAHEALKESKP